MALFGFGLKNDYTRSESVQRDKNKAFICDRRSQAEAGQRPGFEQHVWPAAPQDTDSQNSRGSYSRAEEHGPRGLEQ